VGVENPANRQTAVEKTKRRVGGERHRESMAFLKTQARKLRSALVVRAARGRACVRGLRARF